MVIEVLSWRLARFKQNGNGIESNHLLGMKNISALVKNIAVHVIITKPGH